MGVKVHRENKNIDDAALESITISIEIASFGKRGVAGTRPRFRK
jgi:hypothetical protein